jgi:dynein heavy chain 1
MQEVRNLLWAGFSVPHTISNIAKDAKRVFPLAVSLMQTVRTYSQTVDKVQSNAGIASLVAEYRNDVQAKVAAG